MDRHVFTSSYPILAISPKASSRESRPSRAPLEPSLRGDLLADTRLIAHGTTLATNAVLTRTGAQTALLTTAGLRDTLEMRRGIKEAVFDLRFQAPASVGRPTAPLRRGGAHRLRRQPSSRRSLPIGPSSNSIGRSAKTAFARLPSASCTPGSIRRMRRHWQTAFRRCGPISTLYPRTRFCRRSASTIGSARP